MRRSVLLLSSKLCASSSDVKNPCSVPAVLEAKSLLQSLRHSLPPRDSILESIASVEATYDVSSFAPSQLAGTWRLLFTCNPEKDTDGVIRTKLTSVDVTEKTFQVSKFALYCIRKAFSCDERQNS